MCSALAQTSERHPRWVHIWWLGVLLFTPSVLTWGIILFQFISTGMFHVPFDGFGITRVYLPLIAALIGFSVPIACLRFLRNASPRFNGIAFGVYLAAMLTWAVIDIQYGHYQMGGHTLDGYWHAYFTWYFMPYRWIE